MEFRIEENKLIVTLAPNEILTTIEDSKKLMKFCIEQIIQNKNILEIVIQGLKELEYPYEQTKFLKEIANVYEEIIKNRLNIPNLIEMRKMEKLQKYFDELNSIIESIKEDIISSYKRLLLLKPRLIVLYEKTKDNVYLSFIDNHINPITSILEKTFFVKISKEKDVKIGDRSIYREYLIPIIRPVFLETKFYILPPKNSIRLAKYKVKDFEVEIFKVPEKVRPLYMILAPEFFLSNEEIKILERVRTILAEHKVSEEELKNFEKTREAFFSLEKDLIKKVSAELNIPLTEKRIEELANILLKYTVGYGILERLVADENITDIYINSPIGSKPIFIQHAEFEECETNIIISSVEAENWATKFRLYSGRPLDEANPVLDTELNLPEGRARVAITTRPLTPEGLSFAFRRHRDKPWTLPLFIKKKTINSLFAGLMNFIVSNGRSFLVAGGRGSGKTSLLQALMLEIPKKYRIIVLEDSVTRDCKVLIKKNDKIIEEEIGKVVNKIIEENRVFYSQNGHEIVFNPGIEVLCFDGKRFKFEKAYAVSRHKVKKKIFEIKTRSGKNIKVTEDHSLLVFRNFEIKKTSPKELKIGDYLITPRKIEIKNKKLKKIDLSKYLNYFEDFYITGNIRKFKNKIKEIGKKMGYSKSAINNWIKRNILPVKVFKKLNVKSKNFWIYKFNSYKFPMIIEFDDNFLTLIGLWIADGCYDRCSVIFSVGKENEHILKNFASKFGLKIKKHSDNFSYQINSKLLKIIFKKILKLDGNSHTKCIPNWVYNLSKSQIASLLRGIFGGDGYVKKYEVCISLCSEKLINQLQTLLLFFGVVSRKGNKNKDGTINLRISGLKFLEIFKDKIGFSSKAKNMKLKKILEKKQFHDVTDIIPFSEEDKIFVVKTLKLNYVDYIKRGFNIGREKLLKSLKKFGSNLPKELKNLENIVENVFFDEIIEIKSYFTEDYVYDISVSNFENFVCNNILVHNTLELPVPQMREIGYNIERLKARSVITKVESELPAEEALRTALRLGDSALIIGEIRSTEALTLFEAMRIGALAHVVAGTIHGESAYGVFDRVVNDLKVPKTSFKAVDLIIIAANLKSADGIRRFKRVVEVVEVRKNWEDDPLKENAFVPLMIYNAKEDSLVPTSTLINGESFVIREIMRRVPEFHGNWDLVWENILLRAKIKEKLIEFSEKYNKPELLEAEYLSLANEYFYLISEEVKRDLGYLDSKEILKRWEEKMLKVYIS